MTIKEIKAIRKMYQETKNHSEVMNKFGLTASQEYAINVFGRDNKVSVFTLINNIDDIKDKTTIGEVAIALGYPPESALALSN